MIKVSSHEVLTISVHRTRCRDIWDHEPPFLASSTHAPYDWEGGGEAQCIIMYNALHQSDNKRLDKVFHS